MKSLGTAQIFEDWICTMAEWQKAGCKAIIFLREAKLNVAKAA